VGWLVRGLVGNVGMYRATVSSVPERFVTAKVFTDWGGGGGIFGGTWDITVNIFSLQQ